MAAGTPVYVPGGKHRRWLFLEGFGLKAGPKSYDFHEVSSCPACALPNVTTCGRCAFCDTELLQSAPVLTRVTRAGDRLVLRSGDRVLATACRDGDFWLAETSEHSWVRLVPVHEDEGVEMAMLDEALNVVASVHCANLSRGTTVMLRDAAELPIAIVRADGCGGLNAIAPDGSILLYAGRDPREAGTLDVLLTDAGCERPLLILFGLAVALETQLWVRH